MTPHQLRVDCALGRASAESIEAYPKVPMPVSVGISRKMQLIRVLNTDSVCDTVEMIEICLTSWYPSTQPFFAVSSHRQVTEFEVNVN
jgi:hypothetical protein